jgi:hypothetical protein
MSCELDENDERRFQFSPGACSVWLSSALDGLGIVIAEMASDFFLVQLKEGAQTNT